MRSVNKVILIGNLTRDPEVRQTPNGQSVTTFGIATNRDWVTRDGQRHTSSEYHEIVAWSRLAEICGEYLKKGKLVYIEGYLKTRSWDTPEGIKKFKTEIVIQDMIMLEKRTQGEDQPDFIPDENGAFNQEPTPMPHASHDNHSNHEKGSMNHQPKPQITQHVRPTPPPAPKVETPVKVEQKEPVAAAKSIGPIDIDQDLGL